MLHSRVGSWPCPQTLHYDVKAFQGQSSSFGSFAFCSEKSLADLPEVNDDALIIFFRFVVVAAFTVFALLGRNPIPAEVDVRVGRVEDPLLFFRKFDKLFPLQNESFHFFLSLMLANLFIFANCRRGQIGLRVIFPA
jgi:hypothetical protein